jgi:hypothetical protein
MPVQSRNIGVVSHWGSIPVSSTSNACLRHCTGARCAAAADGGGEGEDLFRSRLVVRRGSIVTLRRFRDLLERANCRCSAVKGGRSSAHGLCHRAKDRCLLAPDLRSRSSDLSSASDDRLSRRRTFASWPGTLVVEQRSFAGGKRAVPLRPRIGSFRQTPLVIGHPTFFVRRRSLGS